MSFAFKRKDADVEAGLRRIARAMLEGALAEAGDPALGFEAAVHRVRRRCKKLRGLLRLVRPGFAGYGTENAAIRDAAAGLAHARDAAVMHETLSGLDLAVETHAPLHAWLVESRPADTGAGQAETLLSAFRQRIAAVLDRVEDWQVDQAHAALDQGFRDTARKLRKRFHECEDSPEAERLHEWRKPVKYHWHHLSLLRRLAPHPVGDRRELVHELGEALGEHHNLAVLVARLADAPPAQADPARAVAERRQAVLEGRALALGAFAAADKPGALAKSFVPRAKVLG